MATPEPSFDRLLRRRHTALVLVSTVDRRIVPALRFVSRLPDTDVRALHVCFDASETRRLAHDWMELGLTWLPLHIHDAVTGSLAASVHHAVGQEATGSWGVTVVVPELEFHRWWHPLLHRRSARCIANELQALPGVTTVIVPYTAFLCPGEANHRQRRHPADWDFHRRLEQLRIAISRTFADLTRTWRICRRSPKHRK